MKSAAVVLLCTYSQLCISVVCFEYVTNPYNYTLTLSTKPCLDEDLVIVVHSAVQNFQRRMLMRSTWLNKKVLEKELKLSMKIVFVTGSTQNYTIQKYVQYEKDFYDDIIQSSFVDSYYNNTLKALSYMRWVSGPQGCPRSKLLLKVDDDALLNINCMENLRNTLKDLLSVENQQLYAGQSMSREVNRNESSKWYIPPEIWPEHLYPVWFQGLAYIITPKLASKLHPIALTTKYMFTDDVYVGVLVSKMQNVTIKAFQRFNLHDYENNSAIFEKMLMENVHIFAHVPDSKSFYGYFLELKNGKHFRITDYVCIFIGMLLAPLFLYSSLIKFRKYFSRRDFFKLS